MFGLLQTRLNQAAWLRLCVCLSFASFSVAARTRALDPAPQLELQWTAPPECPDREQVRQRIAELLQGSSTADQAPVRAVATVSHVRAGFKLALTVKRGAAGGTRNLLSEDCRELSETAAFLVALSIDPNVPEAGAAPSGELTSEPEVEPPVTPKAPTEPKPAQPVSPVARATSLWSLQAGAFAGVWQADAPRQPRLQLGGNLGFGFRMLDVELRYAFALPRDSTVATGSLRTWTQSIGLASCALFGGRFRAGPCGSLSLLATSAEPQAIALKTPPRALWGAVALGAQVATEIVKQIELFTEAGLSVPLSARPNFPYGDQRERVVGASFLGVYARLGLRFRYFIPPGLFHR